MSKIKIGDRVKVKESGVIGTVVSRERSTLGENEVKVEYVVRTGKGFESYRAFTRKEIEKVPAASSGNAETTSPRVYNYEHICGDGRIVVVTGVVGTVRKKTIEHNAWGGTTLYETRTDKKKWLSIGYAICHPSDHNQREVGAEIAFRRAYENPLSFFETPFMGEFREDLVTMILASKAKFVEENIERFINDKQL